MMFTQQFIDRRGGGVVHVEGPSRHPAEGGLNRPTGPNVLVTSDPPKRCETTGIERMDIN